MRPSQTGEVEKHGLRILDLGAADRNRRRRGHIMGRIDHKGWNLSARMRAAGLNLQGRLPGLEDRNVDGVLHLFDPECGRHLNGACVGASA